MSDKLETGGHDNVSHKLDKQTGTQMWERGTAAGLSSFQSIDN